MEAEFEDWMKKYNKTYFDEEEKAMRFQLFKARVEELDSHHTTPRLHERNTAFL